MPDFIHYPRQTRPCFRFETILAQRPWTSPHGFNAPAGAGHVGHQMTRQSSPKAPDGYQIACNASATELHTNFGVPQTAGLGLQCGRARRESDPAPQDIPEVSRAAQSFQMSQRVPMVKILRSKTPVFSCASSLRIELMNTMGVLGRGCQGTELLLISAPQD